MGGAHRRSVTPRALLVPDCGRGVGLGHVERMLALADALVPHLAVSVLVPEEDAVLRARVWDRGHNALEAAGDAAHRVESVVAHVQPLTVIVLDGYSFDIALQHRLRRRAPLTVVDDLGLPADCDLAVNPSPGGESMRPEGADAFLGGATFALLRDAFAGAREEVMRRGRAVRTVLVSSGWTDMGGLAESVSADLRRADTTVEVVVVVGPDTPARDASARPRERVLIAPPSLAEVLAGATVYAGAAGTTAVQAACVGIPAVITVAISNQAAQAAALAAAGCAVVTDVSDIASQCLRLLDDAPRCDDMAARGRALVDGHGAARVAQAVHRLAQVGTP
jgi:UDP-2,4-diacetamido-2,4,6-trideoxy-beta-L-altropyranose hydrolase